MEEWIGELFPRKKLTIVGMIVYLVAVFLPWEAVVSWHYENFFWSFMTFLSEPRVPWWDTRIITFTHWSFLSGFWFGDQARVYSEGLYNLRLGTPALSGSPVGLYLGWSLVFVFQASTIVIWFMQMALPQRLKRKIPIFSIPLLAGASCLFGLCQFIMQRALITQELGVTEDAELFAGFWIALASLILMTVALLDSYVPQKVKISNPKKAALVLSLLLIAGCLFTYHMDKQTSVIKTIVVQRTVSRDKLPGDPNEWTIDFNRIVAVANQFGAHISANSPRYFYCYIDVSIFCYQDLEKTLVSMGYTVFDISFGHIG